MQLANTTTVLNIVNKIVGQRARYADKGVNNTRLLAWNISYTNNTKALEKEIRDLFALVGFTNRVKVTTSGHSGGYGGATYLRINASYNK